MTSLGLRIAKQTAKVLGKYGTPFTHRAVTPGAYDPATGKRASTPSNTIIYGAVEENRDLRDALNPTERVDKKITAPTTSFAVVPTKGDMVTLDSRVYTIAFPPEVIYVGATAAIYVLKVRAT